MFWSDLLIPGVPWIEKIVRPLLVYAALLVLLRLFGKREMAQLNPYDLVVLLTISNTVQNAIIGNDNSVLGGLVGATTLLVFNWFVVRFLYRHHDIDEFIEGNSTVLVEHGCVLQHALDKEADHDPRAGGGGAQAGVRDAEGSREVHSRAGRDAGDVRPQTVLRRHAAGGGDAAPRSHRGAAVGSRDYLTKSISR